MADVLVIGPNGWIGRQVVAELVRRGHRVIGGVRPGGAAPAVAQTVEVDPRDPASVTAAAAAADVVVSALGRGSESDVRVAADAAPALLAGVAAAGAQRLIVVGGAGSLLDEHDDRVFDRPDFPEAWKAGSSAQLAALDAYRADDGGVDWVMLSPSHEIVDGAASGSIELGDDHLLRGDDGISRVTTGDFAVALVDELETPTRHRARFTVRTR